MLNQMENLDTINVMVSTRDCTGVGIFDKWQGWSGQDIYENIRCQDGGELNWQVKNK
jgi:hypothetical protein